jgi:hypothetical protein
MSSVMAWLKAVHWGAPVWVWLVTLVALPVANELIQRAKWTRAQSILQAVARAMLLPFGKVPVLGSVLQAFAGPREDEPPDALPPASSMLAVFGLSAALGYAVLLGACTGALTPTYKTLAGMADAVTAAAGVLPSSCEARQSVLVAQAKNNAELDAAEKAAAEVHAQCEVAGNSLVAASKGLRLARDATRDIDKGIRDPKDLMVWVSAALNLYRSLGPMLATFGVKLPGF